MENKLPHICIATSGVLPIPDVRGGAIEHLVTMLIEDNEKNPHFYITMITHSNSKTQIFQNQFRYTKFINITTWGYPYYKFAWMVRGLLSKLGMQHTYFLHVYERKVEQYLLKNGFGFDLIINEGLQFDVLRKVASKYGKEKLCSHLHCNKISDAVMESTYGNIMAVSDFIRDKFADSSRLDSNFIKTVFNGIDTYSFQKKISRVEYKSLRKQLGIEENDFVYLFCGRLVPQKGIKELIEAFLSVYKPSMKLLIIGSSNFGLGNYGKYPREVKKLVDNNRDKIKFTGFIPNNEIYKYHQLSDVGVVPSTYDDPCPLALFEMITSGLPTIVTKAGGMTQIASEQTSIFIHLDVLVNELKLAIEQLYRNTELLTVMSSQAIERAKSYTRKQFYENFYTTVLGFIKNNRYKNIIK